MQILNWDDLRYCLAVVQEGSVTAAARGLEVNHTTVSRRISTLEKDLNVVLFDRATTGWLITPVGESILRSAEQMQEEVHNIQRSVQVDRQELSGKLRVTAVDCCIQLLLIPGLKAFSAQYPEIRIELVASEQNFDLAVHDADIAFRSTNEPPPNVLGKRIAEFAYAVYGTPELCELYERDQDSVTGITWLGDGHSEPEWMQRCFPGMQVRYRANALNIAFELARQGLGFAQLPCGLGDTAPELRRIPVDYEAQRMGFWLLSHIDLRTTARFRIFRDFMLQQIEPRVDLIEGRMERAWETFPQ
jgi:DNA-binding transcriptional LysR family regulator